MLPSIIIVTCFWSCATPVCSVCPAPRQLTNVWTSGLTESWHRCHPHAKQQFITEWRDPHGADRQLSVHFSTSNTTAMTALHKRRNYM